VRTANDFRKQVKPMSRRLTKFVGACVSATFLAACSGNGFSPSGPLSVAQSVLGHHGSHRVKRTDWAENLLYSFAGGSDGFRPESSRLVYVNGTLYGTTYLGGASDRGTVFAVTPSGTKTTLYSFKGGTDGANPQAELINVNGTLYGTTLHGGANTCFYGSVGCGTVFEITTSGVESILHRFTSGGVDGANPVAGLTKLNGTLYGTTYYGGRYGGSGCYGGCGTVFAITASGTESVIHSFKSGADGAHPSARMIDAGGALFGTTHYGGSGGYGCGTVFKILPSGNKTVLHSFSCNGTDGWYPDGSLTSIGGTLYGTTIQGGANNGGTVFRIVASGAESVLHSFAGGAEDGEILYAGLINVNGTLYGTTYEGGASGDGTVFSITTDGTEAVLYSFVGAPQDGGNPWAALTNVNGTLYGTTSNGGTKYTGGGTVFSLSSLPVTESVLHSFSGGAGDGAVPYAPLVNVEGTLYGTTLNGGPSNDGTVYSITPYYGTETLLHGFTGDPDAQSPYAGLVTLKGKLYGTTPSGGAYSGGAIYSISPTPSGPESVLESFYPGSDGYAPIAGLIAAKGKVYGTTSTGGVYNAGTVFSMKAFGQETVLHNFGGAGDGTSPLAPLLDVGGTLYGTTNAGGAYGGGTVFAVSESSGTETVLHNFGGSGDGGSPQYGQLVSLNGTMYGTTLSGGAYGRGTVYSITPSGTEAVLHSFGGESGDGTSPYAGLVILNGTLYGTTSSGGANNQGTLFSVTPASSDAYSVVWAFGGSGDGAHPRTDLIVVNGTFYGTTTSGGASNLGTVFSLSL
jgi:uncharacterized repeat protein (TIGR03803 family)